MADLARLIPGSRVTQRHGYLACSQRAARRRVVLGPGLGDVDNLVVRVETHARNQQIDKQRRDAPHLPHGAPCDCLGIDEYSAGPREMRQRLFRGGARVRIDDKYRSTSTPCVPSAHGAASGSMPASVMARLGVRTAERQSQRWWHRQRPIPDRVRHRRVHEERQGSLWPRFTFTDGRSRGVRTVCDGRCAVD